MTHTSKKLGKRTGDYRISMTPVAKDYANAGFHVTVTRLDRKEWKSPAPARSKIVGDMIGIMKGLGFVVAVTDQARKPMILRPVESPNSVSLEFGHREDRGISDDLASCFGIRFTSVFPKPPYDGFGTWKGDLNERSLYDYEVFMGKIAKSRRGSFFNVQIRRVPRCEDWTNAGNAKIVSDLADRMKTRFGFRLVRQIYPGEVFEGRKLKRNEVLLRFYHPEDDLVVATLSDVFGTRFVQCDKAHRNLPPHCNEGYWKDC